MKKEIGSFVVGDSTKCTGCKACELACFTVHNRKSNHLENSGNRNGSRNSKTVSYKI